MSIRNELAAFDKLPLKLRDALNCCDECVDPRYILGMYKTQGLKDTLTYLEDIGLNFHYE